MNPKFTVLLAWELDIGTVAVTPSFVTKEAFKRASPAFWLHVQPKRLKLSARNAELKLQQQRGSKIFDAVMAAQQDLDDEAVRNAL